jgi:hypothetical protein
MRSLFTRWKALPNYIKDDRKDKAKYLLACAIFLPFTAYMVHYQYNYDYSDKSPESTFK